MPQPFDEERARVNTVDPFKTLTLIASCLVAATSVEARPSLALDPPALLASTPTAAEPESIVARALVSRLVDYGLVVGGSAGLQFLTSAAFGVPSPRWFEEDTWRLSAWAGLTMSVPLWTYFTLMDAGPSSATLGKRWMGIEVRKDDGSRLTVTRSLLRTAVTFVGWELAHVSMFVPRNFVTDTPAAWQSIGLSVATAWLLADFVVTIVTRGRKGLADVIVGTHLVRPPRRGADVTASVTQRRLW